MKHERLQRIEEGAYYTHKPGSMIFRNGVLQEPGVDYTTPDEYVWPVNPWGWSDVVVQVTVE